MSKYARTTGKKKQDDPNLVWGAEAIGERINRTESQVYGLLRSGALDGAAKKVGHRTICGYGPALDKFPFHKD